MRTLLAVAAVPLLAVSALAASHLAARTYEDLSDEAAELDGKIARLHAGLEEARDQKRRKTRELEQTAKFQAAVDKAHASADDEPKALAILAVNGHYTDATDMRAKLPEKRKALDEELGRWEVDEKRLTGELSEAEAARKEFTPYLDKAKAERDAFVPLKRDIDAYAAAYKAQKARLAAGGLGAAALRDARRKIGAMPKRAAALKARLGALTIPGYHDPAADALEPALDTARLLEALENLETAAAR